MSLNTKKRWGITLFLGCLAGAAHWYAGSIETTIADAEANAISLQLKTAEAENLQRYAAKLHKIESSEARPMDLAITDLLITLRQARSAHQVQFPQIQLVGMTKDKASIRALGMPLEGVKGLKKTEFRLRGAYENLAGLQALLQEMSSRAVFVESVLIESKNIEMTIGLIGK